MPLPPPIFPLCCAHTCGPPDFELLNDRRMEWSPIHPSAQGSSSDWFLQWVCRFCGSSTSMQDIPALPAVSCSHCSTSAAIVFDRPTGRVARFCSCQYVVTHDGESLPPQTPVPPVPDLPPDNHPPLDWFSHGPLSRFASLYGWERGDPLLWVLAPTLGSSVRYFRWCWHSLSRELVSLPTPLVTASRFLLSNLSFGLPTHSPSPVHTPLIFHSLDPSPTCSCTVAIVARRTL